MMNIFGKLFGKNIKQIEDEELELLEIEKNKFYTHNQVKDIRLHLCHIENGKIQNQNSWETRELVHSGEKLFLVEFFDLTPETSSLKNPINNNKIRWSLVMSLAMGVMPSWSLTAADIALATKDVEEAEKLWEKDNKIPGAIMLTQTGKLTWVSIIDMKYFEEVSL